MSELRSYEVRYVEGLEAEIEAQSYAIKLITGLVPLDTNKFIKMLEDYGVEVAALQAENESIADKLKRQGFTEPEDSLYARLMGRATALQEKPDE